jgi:hypothetical protein
MYNNKTGPGDNKKKKKKKRKQQSKTGINLIIPSRSFIQLQVCEKAHSCYPLSPTNHPWFLISDFSFPFMSLLLGVYAKANKHICPMLSMELLPR